MSERDHVADLGSQDPELRNSPIADETDEDIEVLRQEMPDAPGCYFNNQSYGQGSYVRSGTAVLRCDRGIWIPVAPGDPDNP